MRCPWPGRAALALALACLVPFAQCASLSLWVDAWFLKDGGAQLVSDGSLRLTLNISAGRHPLPPTYTVVYAHGRHQWVTEPAPLPANDYILQLGIVSARSHHEDPVVYANMKPVATRAPAVHGANPNLGAVDSACGHLEALRRPSHRRRVIVRWMAWWGWL